MRKEEWRVIPGYEGLYMVSSLGRVWSIKRKIYKAIHLWKGYFTVQLSKNGKEKPIAVHILMARAFIPIPEKYKGIPIEKLEVHHKDFTNTNRLDNLEWVSKEDHLLIHGKGGKKVYQYALNGEFIREWKSTMEIQRETGYGNGSISNCCRGKELTAYGYQWKYEKLDSISPVLSRNERIALKNKNGKNSKKVAQYTLDLPCGLVKVWPSAAEIMRQLGFDSSHITKCCKGKIKCAYGYQWSYFEE